MAKIVTDTIISSSEFAKYYSDKYFFNCSTFKQTKDALCSEKIYIGNGFKLSEMEKVFSTWPDNTLCVIVQFTDENNTDMSDYRVMRIQQRFEKKFIKRLSEAHTVTV